MPPKKKNKAEAAPAVAPLPAVAWERFDPTQPEGSQWVAFTDADAKLLEMAHKAGLSTFGTTEMSFAPNKAVAFDLDKCTESLDGTTRPMRRLVPGAWEWKDDNGVFVGFYDEDNALIETLWRKLPPGEGTQAVKTTALSFNKGFNSMYTFTLGTRPVNGEIKGTQRNEDSGTERELRRIAADVANAVWDTKNFGIAAKAVPTDAAIPAPPPPAGGGDGDDGATLQRGVSFASSVMQPPATWQPQTQPYQLFDVPEGSKEFKDIVGPFQKKLGPHVKGVKIISVTRIQNEPLWKFYALTRFRVAHRNKGDANEQEQLYHGCRVRENLNSIMEYGFDMRVARDGLAGLGIYFALQSNYSNSGYVLQNPDKSKEMLVCRVAVGSHTTGKHGMKRPPEKNKKTGELYDSVSRLPTMYVVFDNSQAYPEYLIKYRHD